MPPSLKIFGLGGVLVFLASTARGHDPLQSYTFVRPRDDTIAVEVVLSASNGRTLIVQPPDVPITDANFPTVYRKLLTEAAPSLFTLTANGTTLAPLRFSVDMDELYDLDFRLVYPRPASDSVTVTANFVKKLDEGHMTHINIFDRTNHNLGDDDLGVDNLSYAFDLPPVSANFTATTQPSVPAATPQSAPPTIKAPTTAASSATAATSVPSPNLLRYGSFAALAVGSFLLFCYLRRKA